MATYEEIYGKRVKELSADPTLDSSYEGQVWYNSTTGTLKSVVAFGAWRSGGNLTQDTKDIAGQSGGTLTAAIKVAGNMPTGKSNKVDLYDGTSWTNTTNYPISAEGVGTFGVQTSQVAYGGDTGSYVTTVNEWNGSSWTAGTAYPQTISRSGGCGREPAGLAIGGYDGSPSTVCKEYDGSSWTAAGGLATGAPVKGASGTQTACLATNSAGTEIYNGTSWSSGTNLSSPRGFGVAASRNGTSTFLIIAGGSTPPGAGSNLTELYDGNAWSTQPTMSTARSGLGGAGTASATIVYGGEPGSGDTEVSEEWDFSINTVTNAAWASGGNMPQRTNLAAASGSQTANIVYGGDTGPSWSTVSNQSVLYDGSSWTAGTNIPGAESNMGGTGTQTAGIYFGGYPNVTTTIEWDGSSFSSGGALSTGGEKRSHNIGIQTAAIACGGYIRGPDSSTNSTEEYNGSSWTAGGNLNTARYYTTGAGTETAGLCMNGANDPSSPPQLNAVEEYNGSSWTAGNSSPYPAGGSSSSGTQTAALLYGGNPSSPLTTTVAYDGTNWSTRPSMANASSGATGGHAAPSDAAIRSGGYNNTSGQTEEFTGETETITARTLTSS